MARRKAEDVERDWYGVFARWDKADREAALKVLAILHRELPERKPAPPMTEVTE